MTAPINKMIAVTIRPGATTAAARLICPFACKSPPPAAARTSAKVPSNSENSRRLLENWLAGREGNVRRGGMRVKPVVIPSAPQCAAAN
jgi:hypothetical protein